MTSEKKELTVEIDKVYSQRIKSNSLFTDALFQFKVENFKMNNNLSELVISFMVLDPQSFSQDENDKLSLAINLFEFNNVELNILTPEHSIKNLNKCSPSKLSIVRAGDNKATIYYEVEKVFN